MQLLSEWNTKANHKTCWRSLQLFLEVTRKSSLLSRPQLLPSLCLEPDDQIMLVQGLANGLRLYAGK